MEQNKVIFNNCTFNIGEVVTNENCGEYVDPMEEQIELENMELEDLVDSLESLFGFKDF